MALDRAPNSPQANQPAVGADRLPTRQAHTVAEEGWRQYVAGFVIAPCVAAGTNAITLTPRLHKEGAATYGDGMAWSFTAANDSTGPVTAAVGDLPAKKVYTNSGALQAGAAVIQADSTYILIYESALDTGNGGFVAFGSLDLSGIYVPLTRVLTAAGLVTGGGDLSADRTFTVTAATQANQEAGSSNAVAVTPGVQQFHPSAAKFWGYATVSAGAPTLQASYNVTSITDTATGVLDVTISTNFSSADWSAWAASVSGATAYTRLGGQTAGGLTIACTSAATGNLDPTAWSFGGFGGQA